MGWPVPSSHWAHHSAWVCGCTGPRQPSPPLTAPCPQSTSSLGFSAWPPPPASTAAFHHWSKGCRLANAGEPFWADVARPCPAPRPWFCSQRSCLTADHSVSHALGPEAPSCASTTRGPSLSHGRQPFWHGRGTQQALTQCWLGAHRPGEQGRMGRPLSPHIPFRAGPVWRQGLSGVI